MSPWDFPCCLFGVFLYSHGLSHIGSHFLLWSCLPSGSVFLLASHQALLPTSPQVPSVVLTPRCYYEGQGGFWQSLCVFWVCRFSLTPRLLELDLFSSLLLLGTLQEWKKTIAILDPRLSLRTSLTDLFVFILFVPESETVSHPKTHSVTSQELDLTDGYGIFFLFLLLFLPFLLLNCLPVIPEKKFKDVSLCKLSFLVFSCFLLEEFCPWIPSHSTPSPSLFLNLSSIIF